jgi:hypothetical protein
MTHHEVNNETIILADDCVKNSAIFSEVSEYDPENIDVRHRVAKSISSVESKGKQKLLFPV